MCLQKLSSKLFLTCLFVLSLSFQSNAQFYEIADYIKRASTARDHISQLQEGTLVIRLRSRSKNIKAMQASLDSAQLSEKQRKRLTKQMNDMIREISTENHQIVIALKKHYIFSEYRVVLDTAMHQLFAKKESGYFLNDDLQTEKNLSIDFSKPVYILKYGPTQLSENNRQEGLVITDFEKNDLKAPFPYLTKIAWPVLAPLVSFIGNDVSPRYDKMIRKVNSSLERFYINAQIKREKDQLRQQIKDLKD